MFATRTGAAALALGAVVSLIAAKVIVAVLTGSISVTAQAADSSLDFVGIAIAFFAVRAALAPADDEHPFGHGKLEAMAAFVQALLIVTAGVLIILAAVDRIRNGGTIEMTEAGIAVMVFSIGVSLLLARHLRRVSRVTGSLALEAASRNINADVYSAAGVLAAMVAIRFTEMVIFDAVIAIGVSILIFKSAWDVVRRSMVELTDERLPPDEEQVVVACMTEHQAQLVDFHAIRTRKAGGQRFIDLHIVMPKDASLAQAHEMCDHLEQDIQSRLPNASVTIHAEPCEIVCSECVVSPCRQRRE
jgi:cation diffusion facilitator family transporter